MTNYLGVTNNLALTLLTLTVLALTVLAVTVLALSISVRNNQE